MKTKHLPYTIHPEKNRFHYYENHWKKTALDLLDTYVKQEQSLSLLDYGCGRGELLMMAKERGYHVQGVDLDPECVRISSAYGQTKLLNVENPVGQLGENAYDVVVCLHVLEHVDSPVNLLRDLSCISKKYVVLAVPNLRILSGLFRRRIDLSQVNEGHLQSWDHCHLLNLAERHCGLKLLSWGFDATVLPCISHILYKTCGVRTTIRIETGLFKQMFPFHGLSVIGLFEIGK